MTYPALAPKQQVTMYAPPTFEEWSYANPDTVGIGGSETALTQMAEHLAARGHSVRVYAPIPPNTPTPHKGVEWLHIDQTDYTRPGHWIVSRAPEIADHFSLQHRSKGQTLWLICQDEDYDRKWGDRPDRRMKFDRIVALCQAQAEQFKLRYPPIADRVCVSSNGVRRDLVESVLAENLERDPYRIIYTSSPDRGLDPLLAIFERLREYVPEATLHVCYGFDNLDKHVLKCEAMDPEELPAKERRYLRWIRELKAKLKGPGIVHHGRMPQRELYRQIAQASVWMYCTSFKETNCLHGDSLVETLQGQVPIRDLAGKTNVEVWSCNSNGSLSVSKMKWCGNTRQHAEVIRIRARPGIGRNAKKEKILTLTPDHKVMLADGRYVFAGDLKPGDRVKAFHYLPNGWGKGYATGGLTDTVATPLHRLAASCSIGRELADGEVVDHLDGNTRNNATSNLLVRPSQKDHAESHWERLTEEEYATKCKKHADGVRKWQDSLPPEMLKEIRAKGMRARWQTMTPDERATWIAARAKAVTAEGQERRRLAIKARHEATFGNAPWRDAKLMERLYIVEQLSTVQIGEQIGCSNYCVGMWLKNHGIPVRDLKQSHLVRRKCSNHTVVAVEPAGTADVYCMEVEPDHNFIADGIVVHNCITSMEHQSLGAIPIVSPVWAVAENVRHGIHVAGSPNLWLTQAQFAGEAFRLLIDGARQEQIRRVMMPWARDFFAYEKWCAQWEGWMVEDGK